MKSILENMSQGYRKWFLISKDPEEEKCSSDFSAQYHEEFVEMTVDKQFYFFAIDCHSGSDKNKPNNSGSS